MNSSHRSPRARKHAAGFSLIEIMIVVLIIGILATLARASVARIQLRSRAATFMSDCRVFSEALNRYAQEKGDFPPDQSGRGLLPPKLAGYINSTAWLRPTPIGGDYDWDNKDATNSLGVTFRAAIRVNGCTLTLAQLQQIDRWFDDGNLSTGLFRVTDGGYTVFHVMEVAK